MPKVPELVSGRAEQKIIQGSNLLTSSHWCFHFTTLSTQHYISVQSFTFTKYFPRHFIIWVYQQPGKRGRAEIPQESTLRSCEFSCLKSPSQRLSMHPDSQHRDRSFTPLWDFTTRMSRRMDKCKLDIYFHLSWICSCQVTFKLWGSWDIYQPAPKAASLLFRAYGMVGAPHISLIPQITLHPFTWTKALD